MNGSICNLLQDRISYNSMHLKNPNTSNKFHEEQNSARHTDVVKRKYLARTTIHVVAVRIVNYSAFCHRLVRSECDNLSDVPTSSVVRFWNILRQLLFSKMLPTSTPLAIYQSTSCRHLELYPSKAVRIEVFCATSYSAISNLLPFAAVCHHLHHSVSRKYTIRIEKFGKENVPK